MSTVASKALNRAVIPWLFASGLATTMPHFWHQPIWLSLFAGVIFGWAFWLWWRDAELPRRWLLIAIVGAGCGGILFEYRTLFGRDAGVAMLVMFMAMKLLELKSRRDAMVIVNLGYFLLLTHYLHSQSIATGCWLLACIWLLTATSIRLHAGPMAGLTFTFRYAATLCLQALPFMLVLYLLFPRISGPLWGLPSDAHAGMTGMSDTMSPGSVARLAQNADIAFRVRFDQGQPAKQGLYWRGPVMEVIDGTSWRPSPRRQGNPSLEAISPPISYETTLEAHNQRWLLALDAPVGLPGETRLNETLEVRSAKPVTERQRFHLSASLDYRFNVFEKPAVLAINRQLPVAINPRTRALAQQWKDQDPSPQVIIDKALGLFNKAFFYTLQPPLLGSNGIDEFLFQSKRGFCEHYAAAFVFLMRAAGIPARVVGGYQGGEYNPLDGYLVVRQSDAHAWAEVWLESRGWVRIDPTAAVSPSRIENGIADALPSGEPLPMIVYWRNDWVRGLRYRWEALNNTWNQNILGYDPQRQRELLARMGLPDVSWQSLAMLLAGSCGLIVVVLMSWAMYRRPHTDPAQRLWHKALRHLRRSGVNCAPWETPLILLRHVHEKNPRLAESFKRVVDAYLLTRYGPIETNLNALRKAVKQLKQ